MTRKQYIGLLLFVHALVGIIIAHKLFSTEICNEIRISEKVIHEQKVIVNNVDARLHDLELAMDSAKMLSDEILNTQSKEAKAMKLANKRLDLENEQLSRAINDVFLDTIVERDTTYINHKK